MRTIDLIEGQATALPANAVSSAEAVAIYASRLVRVDFPNPLNAQRFILRPLNTVGLIPVTRELMLRIVPKVPVSNLFGMLEAVHDLPSFAFYDGIGVVESIEELYGRLAALFARRVADRVRRGLYARYIGGEEVGTIIRGRIDVAHTLRLAGRGSLALHCSHEMHTRDVDENRILLWTLDRIPRLGLPLGDALGEVHAARRALLGTVTLTEMTANDCRNRTYNRLNADYALLHALARFFLEHMGPGVASGAHAFLPFTVDMAMLFQEYVVATLRRFAPEHVNVSRQYRVELGGGFDVKYSIDAVVTDRRSGAVVAVVDAKYKIDSQPSSDDTQQVTAYAAHTEARHAFLVYPTRRAAMGPVPIGPTSRSFLTTMGLALDGVVTAASREFASAIFQCCAK